MRIAMIGQKGIPAHSGGVEQHVDMLARLLADRGHEVTVYCRRSYCNEAISDQRSAISDQRSAISNSPRRVFRPSIPTKHLDAITHTLASTLDIAFRRADVVHYHAIGPAALAPIARLAGLPVVVTVHGLDWQRAKWGRVARRCLKLGERLAAAAATRLVVVSPTLCDYFTEHYGVTPTFIPNGVVPIERRPPQMMRRWGIEPRRFLLAVARLVPEKGLHHLVRAFAQFESDLRLVIAGGGGFDSGYEQELRRLADPRVVFTGPADRELLAELYSHALVFVLPSDLEGMSIALLEAMSMGLPVLVSDIAENQAVVGDIGLTFRAGDATHLKQVLEELIRVPELLPAWGQRAQDRAAPYQWSEVAGQLETIYRDCCGLAAPSAATPFAGPQPAASPTHPAHAEVLAASHR